MHFCQNCGETLQGKYCSQCGQSADTHKLNAHYLWHDIQHGFFHFDKGILFTSRELFTRPGNSIREFIGGKRVKHFKPVSLVLLLAGVYGFLSHYYKINVVANNISVTGSGENYNKIKEGVDKVTEWMSEHYSIVALAQLPIFTLGTYLGFFRKGYNFIEHFVINAFLTGQRLLLHIVAFPLYAAINGTPLLKTLLRATDVIGYGLMAVTLFQLFNGINKLPRTGRVILSLAIAFTLMFSILTGIFALYISSINKG